MTIDAESLAKALGGALQSGSGWKARCPAHDDDDPSLSLSDGEGGRVLVHCFAGCPQSAVVAALRARNLWPNGERAERPTPKAKADNWRPLLPVPSDAPQPTFEHRKLGRPSSAWIYRDTSARTLGYVARFNKVDGGKDILPCTYCQGANGRYEWRWQSFPTPRLLYNLDKLAERPDDWILVVEGEKTADAAAELFPDHVAITSPGGSNAASAADWSPLKGRKAAIWPDADLPGRKYAEDVALAVMEGRPWPEWRGGKPISSHAVARLLKAISVRDGALGVSVPDGLNDRAADNWEPLLAVADRAGGDWPERARKAAVALSGNGVVKDDSAGVMLLGASASCFDDISFQFGLVSASARCSKIVLISFGIEHGYVGDRKKDRGYEMKMFEEAFARYITPSATAATAAALKTNGNSEKQSVANDPGAALSNRRKGNGINGAAVAAIKSPPPESARDIGPDGAVPPWEIIL